MQISSTAVLCERAQRTTYNGCCGIVKAELKLLLAVAEFDMLENRIFQHLIVSDVADIISAAIRRIFTSRLKMCSSITVLC